MSRPPWLVTDEPVPPLIPRQDSEGIWRISAHARLLWRWKTKHGIFLDHWRQGSAWAKEDQPEGGSNITFAQDRRTGSHP